jgi:hypothetical protein
MLTVPVVILGLVAVVAIVQHGAWHQGAGVMSMQKLAWGSGEEADHKVMQDAADSVGDYDYKVEPLPVNPLIIDEVKKAEAEQGKESKTLAAYAMVNAKKPKMRKAGCVHRITITVGTLAIRGCCRPRLHRYWHGMNIALISDHPMFRGRRLRSPRPRAMTRMKALTRVTLAQPRG